ncbi:MAG: hypothetical protein ACJ8AW_45530 [Rhodopila sp.]|jgi:hypothetical protein
MPLKRHQNGLFYWPEYEEWLLSQEGGAFTNAKKLSEEVYAGVKPLLFHWTLIQGTIGDPYGWLQNWCYQTHD